MFDPRLTAASFLTAPLNRFYTEESSDVKNLKEPRKKRLAPLIVI
jgi:hypothetical protein